MPVESVTASKPPVLELRPIDGSRAAVPADLAALHRTLLPESPVVRLGKIFMERFYYSVLPAEGLIFGSAAYVDENAAGFIVATTEPRNFMSMGAGRHPLFLAWLLGLSVLRTPASLAALWEAWRIQRHLTVPDYREEGLCELLSFGVLPAYRERGFVLASGLRISLELLQHSLAQLREHGCRVVRAVVDEDNLEARLFYQGLGWTLGDREVSGWHKPVVEYLWRMDESS